MRSLRVVAVFLVGGVLACNQRDAGAPVPASASSAAPAPVVHEHPAPPPVVVPDAAPAIAAAPPPDAAPPRRSAAAHTGTRDDSVGLQEEAARYADALFSDEEIKKDRAAGVHDRPGADLDSQLSDLRAQGANVAVGGPRGRGGPGGSVGPGTAVGPAGSPATRSSGRVTILDDRALDATSLDADAIDRKIDLAYLPGMRRCYQDRLDRDPAAAAVVTDATLTLTVGTTGRVTDATVDGLGGPLTSCLQARVRVWRFAPPTSAGGATTARFTLQLRFAPS